MNNQDQQLPVNLEEALGATPLTYLVPTQQLAQFVGCMPMTLPVAAEDGTSDYFYYASTAKQGLRFGNADTLPLRFGVRRLEQFDQAMAESPVKFGVLDGPLDGPYGGDVSTVSEESGSLFEGLRGISREIACEVSLISEEQLWKKTVPNSDTAQTAAAPPPPPKQQPVNEMKRSPQKDEPNAYDGNNTNIKKRKSNIGVLHLQIESLAISKLMSLMKSKIGLTDESAEYESSDLWLELPNTDHVLSDEVLLSLEDCLKKVFGTHLAQEIPFDVLERIQILCMRSIKYANEVDWAELESDKIDHYLRFGVNSLKATSLLFSTLNLQRKEKKLYLDEHISESLTFVYKFVEDFILQHITSFSARIDGAVNMVIKIFAEISLYLISNETNDTMITKLEYLSLMVIFSQAERLQLHLKLSSMNLLLTIFRHKADQRSFIIDEILSSFDRLPIHKTHSRQLKFRGLNVQLVTVLILCLIQSLNMSSVVYGFDLSSINGTHMSESEIINKQNEDVRFFNELNLVRSERDRLCTTISSGLISKLINNANASTKTILELFIQDLLNLITLPEWPSAELLLCELTKHLMYTNGGQSALVETYLLEMTGLVGSKMLQIRGPDDPPSMNIADMTSQYGYIYNYLLAQKANFFFLSTSEYFLTCWIESLLEEAQSNTTGDSFKQSIWHVLNNLLSGYYQGKANEIYTIELAAHDVESQSISLYRQILLHSKFIGLYQNFLNYLLKSVDHPKIKSRTRALKNLAMLIGKDSSLLNIPQIKQSLANKIQDSSPLVRLAVLEIFDEYILQKPELIQDFYQSIILTADKSISVRSKSLRISKRIFYDTDQKNVKIFVLEKILRRLEDDEESVLELAKSILTDLFFMEVHSRSGMSDIKLKSDLTSITSGIVGLISKNAKNWDLFESFLLQDIIKMTESNLKIHDILMSVCRKMVDFLFSFIINYMDTERQNEVEQYLGLLSIFSKSESSFVSQEQLLSLQPYLTAENISADTTFYTLVILRNTLTHTSSLREHFLIEAQSSLLKRLTKFSSRDLEQAMPSVWILSEMRKETSKVANGAASCLALIKPSVEKAMKGELTELDPKVLRLLYLLGSFGKFCDLEKNRSVFASNKKFALKEKETVLSLITKNVLMFTKSKVHRKIRRIAIKNLISLASTHPKLFMSDPILNVLDSEFSGSNIDFKETMVQGLLEFLEKEEKNAIRKTAQMKTTSAKTNLDVGVFHGDSKTFENDGICASLVQRYIDPILELCLYDDGDHSLLAVRYLKFIVTLGFANPRVCIPTVIALQASPVPYVRNVGLALHKDLHKKHESLIDSSYIQGLKMAADYRSRLCADILKESHQFFQKFYSVIEESKSTKRKVLNQLIKSWSFNVHTIGLDNAKALEKYVLFLAPNILECEFMTNEEIYILVEGIEHIVGNHGAGLKAFVTVKLDDNSLSKEESLKIGYLSNVITSLHKTCQALRYNFKIYDTLDKSEQKTQKPKMQDKQTVELHKFDGAETSADNSFKEMLQIIV